MSGNPDASRDRQVIGIGIDFGTPSGRAVVRVRDGAAAEPVPGGRKGLLT